MSSPSPPSTLSPLARRLCEYVAAAFTGLWVQSHEHADALAEIGILCRQSHWSLAVWDVDRGFRGGGTPPAPPTGEGPEDTPGAVAAATAAAAAANDPLAAIRALGALASPDSSALLVLPNFHRFLGSAEVVQALAHRVQEGKADRTFVVILAPLVQIPPELEKQFVVIEHDLPDREQLRAIASGIATEAGEMPPAGGEELARLLDAASGLTRFEAEGAFSLSLVRHGTLRSEAVWELKEGMLKKSGLLALHRGGERFEDLGGLEAIKGFCSKALATSSAVARPRGILLLGVPGSGKSLFCKALGNEARRPTLVLDVGSLLGSLVGQTEQNVRQALRIADAMAPCVLMIDEVEKALAGGAASGGGGGGSGDSGVSARLFGTLLTWLSDHASDVFVVATSNDVSKLPPEFARAERFDGIFFLDLPSSAERAKIWPIHLRRYQLDPGQKPPEDRDWTGAEVQSCCRLAALLQLPLKEAARQVVPVAVTAAESVERLRAWAAGRCLDASRPGIYARGAGETAPRPAARRVARPSSN